MKLIDKFFQDYKDNNIATDVIIEKDNVYYSEKDVVKLLQDLFEHIQSRLPDGYNIIEASKDYSFDFKKEYDWQENAAVDFEAGAKWMKEQFENLTR